MLYTLLIQQTFIHLKFRGGTGDTRLEKSMVSALKELVRLQVSSPFIHSANIHSILCVNTIPFKNGIIINVTSF